MPPRRYAQDTAVPVARTRGEIDKLLREWGATGIQWTDDFHDDRVTLRFAFNMDGLRYMARFSIGLQRTNEVRRACTNRYGKVAEAKFEKALEARGKSEHRLLLLWLKAALNAVAAGIVPIQTLFLPFLEGKDGKTVGEFFTPNMPALLRGGAEKLLPSGAVTP